MQNLASLQATPHHNITLQTIDCQHINHTRDAKYCVSTSIPTQYYNATHIDYQNIKRHKIAINPVPTTPLSAQHIATTAVFIHNHTNYPVAPNTCHCLTSYPTPSRSTISAIHMNNANRQQGMQSRNA